MKREVAIEGLKAFRRDFSGYRPNEEMFDMAIEALEQEPVLDKVKQAREEIQKLVDMCGSDTVADLNMKSGLGLALEKIDKLIESEEE